ncbi:MAG: Sec-independent protein translocase protein TatB, partial [Proteobacteria bacterium]|nr:Sec-independent protein translocase protein TatB [Pseudomonadota bacterium]
MFGIGPMELIVIAIVAMVFIGPERLPDVMRKFGRLFVQIRRQTNDVKSTFQDVIHEAEREFELERIRELQQKMAATSPTQVLDAAIQQSNTTQALPQPAGLDEHGHPLPGFDAEGKALAPGEHHAFDYHHEHYVDGKYVKPDDG